MSDNLNLKKKLSKLAFDVTQNSCTERAFSGEFNDFFEDFWKTNIAKIAKTPFWRKPEK